MSKASIVIILGAILLITTVVGGLPSNFMWWLTVCSAAVVVVLGILLRIERQWLLRALSGGHKTDAYEESGAPLTAKE